ncbi:MAG TPA: type II toxin-antitoxin system RelE/ParE family toxin [Mucilaginibacter sp.]|jgi:plasmid stabilization system protein ParE|nr:type II toxin-antitoxin system RelE/ParE family toxin [Mucilaginibacter sp.]
MIKAVVLTPTALKNYDAVIEYLIENWGVSVVDDFIEKFKKTKSVLADYPEIYSFQNKAKQIQKCVLTRHNIIYFKATKTQIKILAVFDTRQDPKKLSKFI